MKGIDRDLLDRFVAGSIERIRDIKLSLAALEEQGADSETLPHVLRELHTLKGEARIMGFVSLSSLAHSIEECVGAASVDETGAMAKLAEELRQTLDVMSRALKGELGDDHARRTRLDEQRKGLLAKANDELGLDVDVSEIAEGEDAYSFGDAAGPAIEGGAAQRFAYVGIERIDDLCERVYEIVSRFGGLLARFQKLEESDARLRASLSPLREDMDRCRAELVELEDASDALRLVPVERSLSELVEHTRDLAASHGKKVNVALDAGGVEVERTVLEEMREPFLHLLRNAVDHGIEGPGEREGKPAVATIRIAAHPVNSDVVFSISDDGRGIDPEAVRRAAVSRQLIGREEAEALDDDTARELVFQHGFSTRETATELSGRGVGLDVVKSKVEKLGGTVELTSRSGQGTSFTIVLPSRITRDRVLVVQVADVLLGISSRCVLSVEQPNEEDIVPVAGGRMLRRGQDRLPLRSLAAGLGFESPAQEPIVAIVALGAERCALTVPRVVGEFELARRGVDDFVARFFPASGSAQLDDGRLVLLLRLDAIFAAGARAEKGQMPKKRSNARALVVDDSPVVRELISQILRGAGLEVKTADSGVTALATIERWTPDLVMSDVEMPQMNGLELLRRIRERSPHLPVVMLTTRGSVEDKRVAAELGANAYLVKSEFEETKLLQTVSRFVDVRS